MKRISVVIPACNEAASIGATLQSIALQVDVAADVVVVANGCTDDTVNVAAGFVARMQRAGHGLKVLEAGRASKTDALNLGEGSLEAFPRAYIDADVILTPNALSATCAALDRNDAVLAAPQLEFRAHDDPWSRRMVRLFNVLPPFSTDVVGGGFYAVNAAGRRRWAAFPTVIADDTFVCGLFERAERIRVEEAAFTARFPDRGALQAVLNRWEAGRQELRGLMLPTAPSSKLAALTAIAQRPLVWRAAVEFLCRKRLARKLAKAMSPEQLRDWWPRAAP